MLQFDRTRLLEEATSAHQRGQFAAAERLYRQLLDANANDFDALNRLGIVKLKQGKHDEARHLIGRALVVDPGSAKVQSNLGSVLMAAGQFQEALSHYEVAIKLEPEDHDHQFNRGSVLQLLGRYAEARDCIEPLARTHPGDPEILGLLANLLWNLGLLEEALAVYERALVAAPEDLTHLKNRGNVLFALKRYAEAGDVAGQVLARDPMHSGALALGSLCAVNTCDWSLIANLEPRLRSSIESGLYEGECFPILALFDDPLVQQKAAAGYAAKKWKPKPLPAPTARARERLRIGYLSADFRAHPVSFLIAGLIEAHDRSFCNVYGFSAGSEAGDPWQARLKIAFDRFIEVRQMHYDLLCQTIRNAEIDILVDLGGYTQDSRIFALHGRPAPIQISYLGYPGSTGAPFVDYLLADPFVVPEDVQALYSEKIVYLPDCFQANDAERSIGSVTPTRVACGLPDGGFVFCAFHNAYKINPACFDIWMRLLAAVPGSVIWLTAERGAHENLRREAQARNIDPNRLVFAPTVNYPEHLARQKLADLFLDAWPYNGGTTASDALWVGLPVLTCSGRSYAARMAGSLLQAVGLPELITYSPEAYEALALKLATEPGLLAGIRQKLSTNIKTAPLFDTGRFCKHLEAAYRTMWDRHERGEPPTSFTVERHD